MCTPDKSVKIVYAQRGSEKVWPGREKRTECGERTMRIQIVDGGHDAQAIQKYIADASHEHDESYGNFKKMKVMKRR